MKIIVDSFLKIKEQNNNIDDVSSIIYWPNWRLSQFIAKPKPMMECTSMHMHTRLNILHCFFIPFLFTRPQKTHIVRVNTLFLNRPYMDPYLRKSAREHVRAGQSWSELVMSKFG